MTELVQALRRHLSMLRFRSERGIALVMALGLITVLTISGTAVTYYATTNLTASGAHKAKASAYDLAEAGINDAVATLTNQLNSDGSVKTGAKKPTDTTLLSTPVTVNYAGLNGSVTYSGALNTTTWVWLITSTGKVKSGLTTQSKTLKKSVAIKGLNQGADGSSWSRFYADSTSSCLTIDGDNFVTNVATKGNLCIKNGGGVSGSNTVVDVGGTVTISGPGPFAPSSASGWTNSSKVYSSDSQYATNAINAASTGSTLDSKGFGYGLPSNATINGISVDVTRMASLCCNAVQTISVTGSPTGGTFKLNATKPGGSSTATASIAYNASASTVQAALITIFGSGAVSCTGGSLPGTAVVCTFTGTAGYQPITLMTKNSTAFTGGSSPNVSVANTTIGSTGALQDSTVQLLKAGSTTGSNKASSTTWANTGTTSTVTYGSSTDLWGTTWTATDINNTSFGLRFIAKNVAAASSTASVDSITITVYYTPDPDGIGTSGTPIKTANIGGTCQYRAQSAHTPCTSTDHVYAGTITSTSAASNPALVMPAVDFSYWWANAKPGPKHFCTNSSPGLQTNFFDNNASTTSAPDASITVNGEMAPATSDYTCQVVENGVLQGELSWNHTTHVMTISGTIFVDGNFRWDEDGQIVHYFGRANIMSSADDEIDALVCAGGPSTLPDSNDYSKSCLTNMSSWDQSQNMAVLMSEKNNEYDQGGSGCPGPGTGTPNCYNGHPPAGFQGILYSTADCLIHQSFQDSGPVICKTITLPNEEGINPTFYTFPFIGNLTDGQKYGDASTATNFEISPGDMSGG